MVYLLYGEDTYLRDESLKRIKKGFGDLHVGINYIQIDQSNLTNLISDIETPAFGYDRKLIVVKESGLFKKKNNEADIISEYISNNNIESIELVFIEEQADKNDLYKVIEKIGRVQNFEEQKTPQLIQKIKSIASAYKVNIDNSNAQYLIECCGTNMNCLINEIRKLIEYAGKDGTIRKEDIDSLSIKNTESIIFELTDNFGKRNAKKTIEVLNNLIYSKEPIQRILVMLYSHIKKLYIVKLCNGNDLIENLNLKPNQTFLVTKYKTQANYFKEEELEQIIIKLINLDESYKIGDIDLQVGLESILCRYV